MKHGMTFLGIAGACVACCATPLLLPLLGAGAFGAAWISPELAMALGASTIVAALLIGIRRQRKASVGLEGQCGCGDGAKTRP